MPENVPPVPEIPPAPSGGCLCPNTARKIIENRLGTRLPRATFYRMIDDGRILTKRLGSRIIITWQALEQFLDRCEKGERY